MTQRDGLIRGESLGAATEVFGTRLRFIDLWVFPHSYKCTQDKNATVVCGLQGDNHLPNVSKVTFTSK